MNMYESREDYLERILILQKESNHEVRAITLAKSFGFSKPSVSIALKKLQELGFIDVSPKGVITLTESGLAIASKTYEKHMTVCACLKLMGVPKEIACVDACKIEHCISNETFEAISNYVKNSTH